jgi:hypothetical protein
MKPRICICCSEPLTEDKRAHICNPNVCSACFSLLAAMENGDAPTSTASNLKERFYPISPMQISPFKNQNSGKSIDHHQQKIEP